MYYKVDIFKPYKFKAKIWILQFYIIRIIFSDGNYIVRIKFSKFYLHVFIHLLMSIKHVLLTQYEYNIIYYASCYLKCNICNVCNVGNILNVILTRIL